MDTASSNSLEIYVWRRRRRALGALALTLLGALALGACGKDGTMVCVVAPCAITITPVTVTLAVGDTVSYRSLVTGCSGGSDPCAGSWKGLSSHAVRWSLSRDTIANIIAVTDSTALLRATASGAATVIATSVEDSTIRSGALLTVK